MESFATPYTILFNDGEREADKGVLGIHSCLTFKRFQSMIGQKTGLPPAQLATVFVCKRTAGGSEKKQTIPINEKTNFGIILSQHNPSRERDCFFLVSLKRSKKERKSQKKRVEADYADDDGCVSREEDSSRHGVFKDDDASESDEKNKESVPSPAVAVADDPTGPEQFREDAVNRNGGAGFKASTERDVSKQMLSSASQGSLSEPSAWKKGSLLQRLSSADGKAVSSELRLERDVLPKGSTALLGEDGRDLKSRRDPILQEKSSGTASPTSVLGPRQLRAAPTAIAPPGLAVGALPCASDRGGFQLFGSELAGVDLRSLVQGALASNMHLKGSRWCKFCAFCRERNVTSPPFHWCVDDQVVAGFKGPNPAGPIGARPMKHRVAAA